MSHMGCPMSYPHRKMSQKLQYLIREENKNHKNGIQFVHKMFNTISKLFIQL